MQIQSKRSHIHEGPRNPAHQALGALSSHLPWWNSQGFTICEAVYDCKDLATQELGISEGFGACFEIAENAAIFPENPPRYLGGYIAAPNSRTRSWKMFRYCL